MDLSKICKLSLHKYLLWKGGRKMADIRITGANGVVGVATGMTEVCDDLLKQASSIEGYINDLEALKNQLPNDWEGEDLETLLTEFASFKEKLDELPLVIKSIADWGFSAYEAYTSHAKSVSSAITAVLQ